MWHALVASLLLMQVGPPVQPAAPAAGERIPARFQHRLAELERCAESLPPGCGDSAVEALLGNLWSLAGHWAAGQLGGHPDASAEDLAGAIRKLAPDSSLEVSVVRLASGPAAAYVFAMTLAGHGSVLAVARQPDGSFKAVWNLHEVALKHATAGDEISHWGVPGVRSSAAPLAGSAYALPAAPGGHARFYVDAVSRPPAGGTFPGQISVWEWDGREPKCLFVKSYTLSLGTTRGAKLEADRLELHTKEDFKRFYSCGDCPDPEAVWTLRIKADGVEDLGRQLLTPPELGTADELVDRMTRQQDISDLAVLGVIRRLFEALQEYGIDESGRYMLDSWSVEQQGESTVLHLRAVDFPPLDLTFEQRAGHPFATSLDIPGDSDSETEEPP
jgi:hypothetical protein